MGFEVPADDYGRFMGRYSQPLADQFVGLVDLAPGERALDVGCGPGALTARLIGRLGVPNVSAIDPSAAFVASVEGRWPDLDVRRAVAEEMPFPDGTFQVAAAQLVVHFMSDPVAGLREMGRVAAGGAVTACVWDHAGGRGPLSPFWRAVARVDPGARNESRLPGAGHGSLGQLARAAGLTEVREGELEVTVAYESFEQWWEPYTLGVGPAGEYVARLDDTRRAEVREACRGLLPDGGFDVTAVAWTVVARA